MGVLENLADRPEHLRPLAGGEDPAENALAFVKGEIPYAFHHPGPARLTPALVFSLLLRRLGENTLLALSREPLLTLSSEGQVWARLSRLHHRRRLREMEEGARSLRDLRRWKGPAAPHAGPAGPAGPQEFWYALAPRWVSWARQARSPTHLFYLLWKEGLVIESPHGPPNLPRLERPLGARLCRYLFNALHPQDEPLPACDPLAKEGSPVLRRSFRREKRARWLSQRRRAARKRNERGRLRASARLYGTLLQKKFRPGGPEVLAPGKASTFSLVPNWTPRVHDFPAFPLSHVRSRAWAHSSRHSARRKADPEHARAPPLAA